jgi:hypothetical protein
VRRRENTPSSLAYPGRAPGSAGEAAKVRQLRTSIAETAIRHRSILAHHCGRRSAGGGAPQGEPSPVRHRRARSRLLATAPRGVPEGDDRVEVWDAGDFPPWETLNQPTVRVLRYRQHKRNGTVVQAEWITNFSIAKLGSLSIYRMAKSRWKIENRCFNDGKNRYGMEHICHHESNSILIVWLLILLALVIERLYRLRYLHRGEYGVRSATKLCDYLWLTLKFRSPPDTG